MRGKSSVAVTTVIHVSRYQAGVSEMRAGGRRARSNVIRRDINQRALVLLSASVRLFANISTLPVWDGWGRGVEKDEKRKRVHDLLPP